MDIAKHAARLEALGSETRLTILRLLANAGEDGLTVGAVQRHTGVARSTLSHHMHKLISVGLASQRRAGTSLYCSVEYPALHETLGFLRDECGAAVYDNGAGGPEEDPYKSRRPPCRP